MPLDVETILRKHGPTLSSEIAEMLVSEGISHEAARQRISRTRGKVRRLGGVHFPNREAFLFLEGQFGTPDFRRRLEESFVRSGSSFGRALNGLRSRGGAIPHEEFPIASGLPTQHTKGHLLHANVEAQLIQLRLVVKTETLNGNFAVLHDATGPTNRTQGVRIVENLVLAALRTWLVKTNWTSPNGVRLRGDGDLPLYGQYAWAFTCPTYLAGMVTYRNDGITNGFVVGDILLDRRISIEDLGPFFAKWDALVAQKRSARLQTWFIAEYF